MASALIAAPHAALACSVCSAGRDDETRAAFIATTGFMTLLPLALIGGLLWWLRRRARELERAHELDARLDPVSRTSSSQ